MVCYYLDTCIWLDLVEERHDDCMAALLFISQTAVEDSLVLFSDVHLWELKKLGFTKEEIANAFKTSSMKNLRKVHLYREQVKEAGIISSRKEIPRMDVLHAILARDNDAIFVSRDRHFTRLNDIVETKTPEELLQ